MSEPPPSEPPGASPPLTPESSAPTEPRGRRAALLVGILGLLVVIVAGVVVFRPSDAQSLSLAFRAGQEMTYRWSMTMDVAFSDSSGTLPEEPTQMEIEAEMGWEVLDVDEEGIATVRVSLTDMAATMNGQPMPGAPADFSAEMKIAPDGTVVEDSGLGLAGSASSDTMLPGSGQLTPILPEGEVEPGDTWTKTYTQEMPFGMGDMTISTENELLRYEEVDGAETAVIASHMIVPMNLSFDGEDLAAFAEGTGDTTSPEELSPEELAGITAEYGGEMTLDSTTWLDLTEQLAVRMEMDGAFDISMRITGLPVPGGVFQMDMAGTMTQEMERV